MHVFAFLLPPPPLPPAPQRKHEWAANDRMKKYFRSVDGTVGPWGSKEFQAYLRGDLIQTAGLFNLEKMMVWVLRKELEYKAEKLKYKKVGGHAP